MCGYKTKMVPETFYKTPHVNIFETDGESSTENLIERGKLDFSKKKLIIYNPNSGRKIDVRSQIEKHLQDFEFYETKGYLDALNYVKSLDLASYSCVVAVGGDGTIHEVINGMLMRPDGQQIPIGMLPNGSGNDTVGGLQIDTLIEGL